MGIKLEDVDKNFKVESTLGLDDVKFHDVRKAPFSFYGADPSTFEGEEYAEKKIEEAMTAYDKAMNHAAGLNK